MAKATELMNLRKQSRAKFFETLDDSKVRSDRSLLTELDALFGGEIDQIDTQSTQLSTTALQVPNLNKGSITQRQTTLKAARALLVEDRKIVKKKLDVLAALEREVSKPKKGRY